MGGFLKKKSKATPFIAPVREQTEWEKRAGENVGTYGDWIGNNWESSVTSPKLEDYYDYAETINKPAMNDFLQSYNTQANKIAARNYNRFGGLNSTPALYTQDMLNTQMNKLSTELAAQELRDAVTMKNTDWNNQLTALNQVLGMYNQAGALDYGYNKEKYNTEVGNLYNQYQADEYNKQNKSSAMDYISNILSGSTSGAMQGWQSTGSPWGALGGAIAGGLGGAADTYSGTGNRYTQSLLSPFTMGANLKSGMMGNAAGSSIGNFLGTKAGGLFTK